jgi:hypothetical protein
VRRQTENGVSAVSGVNAAPGKRERQIAATDGCVHFESTSVECAEHEKAVQLAQRRAARDAAPFAIAAGAKPKTQTLRGQIE